MQALHKRTGWLEQSRRSYVLPLRTHQRSVELSYNSRTHSRAYIRQPYHFPHVEPDCGPEH